MILEELRRKHPELEIESCSSGGGRVDLGVMKDTDEVWTSDNTDAFDRLLIQDGFSYGYTPAVMMAWVTDSPTWVNKRSLSLEYRFLSSSRELHPFPRVYLRGLDEGAVYSVSAWAGKLGKETLQQASGAYWMHHGVDVDLRGDFQAAAFTLTRVN